MMGDGKNRNQNRLNDLIRCCEGKCNLFGHREELGDPNWGQQIKAIKFLLRMMKKKTPMTMSMTLTMTKGREGNGREEWGREESLVIANCNAANKQTNVHTLFECAFDMEMEIEMESNAHLKIIEKECELLQLSSIVEVDFDASRILASEHEERRAGGGGEQVGEKIYCDTLRIGLNE